MAARPRKPLKQRARDMFRHRFTCGCCPGRNFRGYRELNAHHLARHSGYWASQKARATGRKMSKQADAMRRHARGWRESHGLIDHNARATARGRSRPDGPVRKMSDLRERARHHRAHDRAERREQRAKRATARDHHHTAGRHQRVADRLRSPWPQRQAPLRTPARPRPAPAANGRTSRQASRPRGRLAPSRPAPANGRTRT